MVATQELIDRIAKEVGVSKAQARRTVDAMIETIQESLARGEEVRLTGFGTFRVQQTAERVGRNPRTGEPMRIPAGKRPAFSPGTRLVEVVKGQGGTRPSRTSRDGGTQRSK
jgi:DNA-binding protein HU-beta